MNKKRKFLQILRRLCWHEAIEFPADWAFALIESSQQAESSIFKMLFTPSPNKLIKIPSSLGIVGKRRSEGDEENCHAHRLEPHFFAFKSSSTILFLFSLIKNS